MADNNNNEKDLELEGLPSNVTSQGTKADEMQRQLMEGKTAKGIKPPTDQAPGQSPPDEGKKEEFICQICGKSFGSQQALAAHSRVHAEKPGEGEPPGEKPKGGEDFEQKYQVLQGKYNAEIAQLRESNATLRVTLDSANQTISNMSTILKELKGSKDGEQTSLASEDGKGITGQKPGTQPAPNKSLDPENYDGYGEEMKELVVGFNALVNENAQLKQVVGGVTQKVNLNDKDRYYERLDQAVSDWETINKSPDFLSWLDQIDPMSGRTRDSLLHEADTRNDHQRVTNIFNAFKKESGLPLNAGNGKQPSPNPSPKNEMGSGLESQILPDESGGQTAITSQKLPMQPENIKQATKDFVDGKITQEEYDRITNEFQQQIKTQLAATNRR